jgi:hypothetical protein
MVSPLAVSMDICLDPVIVGKWLDKLAKYLWQSPCKAMRVKYRQ